MSREAPVVRKGPPRTLRRQVILHDLRHGGRYIAVPFPALITAYVVMLFTTIDEFGSVSS